MLALLGIKFCSQWNIPTECRRRTELALSRSSSRAVRRLRAPQRHALFHKCLRRSAPFSLRCGAQRCPVPRPAPHCCVPYVRPAILRRPHRRQYAVDGHAADASDGYFRRAVQRSDYCSSSGCCERSMEVKRQHHHRSPETRRVQEVLAPIFLTFRRLLVRTLRPTLWGEASQQAITHSAALCWRLTALSRRQRTAAEGSRPASPSPRLFCAAKWW